MFVVEPRLAVQDIRIGLHESVVFVQFQGVALRNRDRADLVILEMSRFNVGCIVVHSELWISSCIEPSSPTLAVKISESCDCSYLKGIIVLEFDSRNLIGVACHCPSLNVSGTGLA